jgi:DNA-binding transcriptional LysR family regulator
MIMDRLDAMTVLLKVVDRGSFSAASRELGLPLATVSRKVSELETRLGTKLLLRTTRKIALTAAVQEVPISPRLTVSTAEAAVWAAIQGTGVARVLHYQCAEAVTQGELRVLLGRL